MKTTGKLSGDERREAIILAVRKVFAERGFHGTTTRALAEAAGVSEALLFKHFPNKEALYSAMQAFCSAEKESIRRRLQALEPLTSTLVLLVHMMVTRIVRPECTGGEDPLIQHRLMLRSMLEDGEFARLFMERSVSCWLGKVQECLAAAVEAGDAVPGPVLPRLGAFFAHHLAKTIMLTMIPERPVIDYGLECEPLIEQAVWFSLRGMGVKDEAIKRYYNPQGFSILGP